MLNSETLADALGRVVADAQREWRREAAQINAETRAVIAELKNKCLQLESDLRDCSERDRKRASEDIAKAISEIRIPKDGDPGKSVTTEDVAPLIADEVAKALTGIRLPEDGKPGTDGKDVDPETIKTLVAEAVAAIPPAEKGKDADPEQVAALVKAEAERILAGWERPNDGAPGEKGADGAPGRDGTNGVDGRNGLDAVKFFRDDKGHLIVVKSDGSTDDLGEYVGKDGAPGVAGKDGLDGIGFDDMDLVETDEGILLRFIRGEIVKEWRLPIPRYLGIFKEGQTYRIGDVATWGGHTWHCDTETTDKPDGELRAWTMMVRRGRDGKDATPKKPGPKKGE